MAMAWDANLDPEIAELVNAAFDKSWQFVKTDPELAHGDPQEMRTRLSQNLALLAQNGERDLWRLANAEIGQLRPERSAAEHAVDSSLGAASSQTFARGFARAPSPRRGRVAETITPLA